MLSALADLDEHPAVDEARRQRHARLGQAGGAARRSRHRPRPHRRGGTQARTRPRATVGVETSRPGRTAAWPSLDCISFQSSGRASGSTPSRATCCGPGELARLIEDDAVVGVTSNPTIFQKALAAGDAYDEQLRAGARGGARPEGALLASRRSRTSRTPATFCARSGTRAAGVTATSRSRSTRRSPTTRRRRSREAERLHELVDRPNLFVKIPATEPGLPAIEEMIARGSPINVTLIFSLDATARSPRPTSGASSAWSRPAATRRRRVGGQLLRLPGGHRGRRSASRRSAATTSSRASSRSRTRSSRTRLQGDLLRRAAGRPWPHGRDDAALPLGVHLDEEPGLPRRDVRRGADRAGDREHDAGGDDRGLPGPRPGRARRSRRESTRRTRLFARARRGRRRLRRRDRRRSSARASRSSPTRSPSCSTASEPSRASSSRRSPWTPR